MPQKFRTAIAVIGIDFGKNSFHVVGRPLQPICPATSGNEDLAGRINSVDGTAGWTRTTDLRSHNPTL
jgi:hypothetical protein